MLYSPVEAPADVGYVAYIVMFYLGVGGLFPWNAFITASNYYFERFCGTIFESDFESFFSFTYTFSQVIGLALAVRYQNNISLKNKIVWPLICYSGIFLINTILVTISDIDPTLLFWLTLLSSFMCGSFGALLSSGQFGLGAMFPSTYTASLMTGSAMSGLAVAVSNILTSLASDPVDDCNDDFIDDGDCSQSVDYSALAYFIIATLILLTCAFAFIGLIQLPFTKYYIARSKGQLLQKQQSEAIVNPISNNSAVDNIYDSLLDEYPTDSKVQGLHHSEEQNRDRGQEEEDELTFTRIWSIYQCIRIPSFSVFFVFTVSIGLYPSLTVFIQSTNKCNGDDRFSNDLFVPFLFIVFTLFDVVGRILAGATRPILTPTNIWIASVSRTIFFPLFLLCNVSDSQLPVVFNNDVVVIIFMIFMGLSNGYVASNAMMMGASAVNVYDAPVAGTIMILSLSSGLLSGACLSFLVVFISQGSLSE